MLLSGAMSDWRLSPVRLIHLRIHFMTHLLLGIVLVIAPFVFDFSANGAATRSAIILGALEPDATVWTIETAFVTPVTPKDLS
jgi:SPW repeat